MLEWFFLAAFHFLGNNFEILFPIVLSVFIVVILLFVALKFQEISFRAFFYSTFKGLLFMLVVVGEALLIALTGYVYWANYEKPDIELRIQDDLQPTTQWVKQDLTIYFIDGKGLFSIHINGKGKKKILTANEDIKEYYFSPDGQGLLAVTRRGIYYWNRKNQKNVFIDGVDENDESSNVNAAISGIRWAPNSRKFCYEVTKWSKYSSQNYLYIYDLEKREKISIQTPSRQISFLYWDKKAENLYYIQHDVKNNEEYAYPYEVKVFRIVLKEAPETVQVCKPELVAVIPFDSKEVPVDNLKIRRIDLFVEGNKLVFNASSQRESLVSEEGSYVGIDKDDYLYFVKNKWFHKRLFKILRLPVIKENAFQHQYKGGELTIQRMRWLPGGRYIIMEHRYLGPLILEPSTGKVGSLMGATGNTVGWYQKIEL